MLAVTDDEIQRVTQQIAATLGETHHGLVEQIERFVRLFGVEWVQAVLRETLATQAQGGLRRFPMAAVAARLAALSSIWLDSA